jgi:hypothetical protein
VGPIVLRLRLSCWHFPRQEEQNPDSPRIATPYLSAALFGSPRFYRFPARAIITADNVLNSYHRGVLFVAATAAVWLLHYLLPHPWLTEPRHHGLTTVLFSGGFGEGLSRVAKTFLNRG